MTELPQRQLFRYDRLEKPVWIFPDVAACNCLYPVMTKRITACRN